MKKNTMARLLFLMLSVIMLVSVVACGNNKTNKDDGNTQDEQQEVDKNLDKDSDDGTIAVDKFRGEELEIAIIKNTADKSSGDFNEKTIIKQMEETTGIHINWIVIDQSTAEERIDTILATDDLPDAFLGLIGKGDISTNPELFYDLSKDNLLETYAPDVLDDYKNGGQNVLEMLKLSDGSIRSLCGGLGSAWNSEANGMWYINKAWLEQIDKEIPTTADELYEVLLAWKENDMNGNGDKTDEIPMSFCDSHWAAHFMNYANPFGIAGSNTSEYYLNNQDGKISGTVNTEAYRAFLDFYNKLAKDGLLDVEGFSQTTDQYAAKIAEGKVGIFMEWDTSATPNPDDYVPMIPFKGMDGVEVVKSGMKDYFFGNLTAFVASAECKNIEALLHWWNVMSSTLENKLTARLGDENTGWHYDEAGNILMGPLTKEEGVNYSELEYTQGIGNSTVPYITPDEELATCIYDENYVRNIGCKMVEDILFDRYILTKIVDSSASEERKLIETDLIPFINEFRATSVIEGVTDDTWNKYVEELKDYKYDEWLNWYQRYIDGEF